MSSTPRIGEAVAVEWLDAARTDDAVNPLGTIGIVRHTVGWLLRDDEAGIVLAMTYDAGEYERGFWIPRAYVQSARRLK